MDYAKVYVVFSMSVGLLQIFDNVLLLRAAGRLAAPNMVISLIELFWLIISALAIFKFDPVPKFLPLSFLIIAGAGMIYGTVRFWDVKPKEGEVIPSDLVMPRWTLVAGLIFGVYYTLASYLVYQQRFLSP